MKLPIGLRLKAANLGDKLAMWLAWRLPKRVCAWAGVRIVAFATTGAHSGTIVPELSAMDALKRWESAEAVDA